MRQTSAFSVLGATFVASYLVLVSLLVNPVAAQPTDSTDDDPLAGIDVTLEDTDGDEEELANRILIPMTDCTIATNASVTVRNVDGSGQPTGPPIEVVNGQADVQITQDPTEIVIENADQNDLDSRLKSGVGEVVESTGFTCGNDTNTNTNRRNGDDVGGDGPDDQQYADDRKENVITETVPDKPLPKTGGFPILVGAGLMALAATVLGARVIGRR